MFLVWMGKCSLKTESKVLWNRSYASLASSLINTGFQLISFNSFLNNNNFNSPFYLGHLAIANYGHSFLKFDKFSSEKNSIVD